MAVLKLGPRSHLMGLRDTGTKIARTFQSTVKWISNVCLPSSNIPLVVGLTKMSLIIDQLPFTLIKGTFVVTGKNQCRRISAVVVILFHLAVVLKWVLDNWLDTGEHSSPIWKFVLMYHCVSLFSSIMAFIVHITKLKGETIWLLNAALQIERDCRAEGEFLFWCVLLTLRFG